MKKAEDGNIFVVKTMKLTDEAEAQMIREKKEEIQKKRRQRRRQEKKKLASASLNK